MNTQVDVPEVLSNTTIFRGMDQHQMERIGSICVERYVTAGDEIFPQGSASDELYVVANGEVDILLDRSMSSELEDAGHVTIATIRRGEAFGEIALVDQGVRSATARCGLSDTCVLVIRRADLIELYAGVGKRQNQSLVTNSCAIWQPTSPLRSVPGRPTCSFASGSRGPVDKSHDNSSHERYTRRARRHRPCLVCVSSQTGQEICGLKLSRSEPSFFWAKSTTPTRPGWHSSSEALASTSYTVQP